MRIDFNVLLVDDLPENIDPHVEALQDRAADEGFALRLDKVRSVEEAKSRLRSEIFQDNVDLVLVDWDLGSGGKGDDAIAEIRRVVQYRDIVFYSGKTVSELRELIYKKGIEGVFVCHRDGLRDKLLGVFDALIKKALDLDHCRGIVMGVTSDIDFLVLRLVNKITADLAGEQRDRISKYITKKLKEKADAAAKLHETFSQGGAISDVLAEHSIFSSYHRLALLRELLKVHLADDTKKEVRDSMRRSIHTYMEDVTKRRNTLGHVSVKESESGRVLVDHKGKEVTADDLRTLRKELIAHRENFDKLAQELGVSEEELLEAMVELVEELEKDDEATNEMGDPPA